MQKNDIFFSAYFNGTHIWRTVSIIMLTIKVSLQEIVWRVVFTELFTLRRIHPLACDENMKRIFNILLNNLKNASFESPFKYSHFSASKVFDSLFFVVTFDFFFVEIQRFNELNIFGCKRNFTIYKVSYDVSIVLLELHEILVILRSINSENLRSTMKSGFCSSSACFTSSRRQSMLISYVCGKAFSRIKANLAVGTALY